MDCCLTKCVIVPSCCVVMLYFLSRWFKGARCTSKVRLTDKTVIITGANTGIGKATAIDLAKRGAHVVMACRNKSRGEIALKEVQERSGSSKVALKLLDLASLNSIIEFSNSFLAEYPRLDILVNNAGLNRTGGKKTEDGFEMLMGVHHLGHFALTNLLLQRMTESEPGSRIINVSSIMHRLHQGCSQFNFENMDSNIESTAYGQSKLANILFTKELHRKLSMHGAAVSTYSLHPGFVASDIFRNFFFEKAVLLMASFFGKSVEQGAQTSIYCAVEEGIEQLSGSYFSDCAVTKSSAVSCNEGVASKLWEVSERMTQVKFPL